MERIVFAHSKFEVTFARFILIMGLIVIPSQTGRPKSLDRIEAACPDSPAVRIYRRDEPRAPEDGVEILFTGDIMLGRGLADVAEPFEDVSREISAADLAVGNLEGMLANDRILIDKDQSRWTGYTLSTPADGLKKLQMAGFDILGLANNHAYDQGVAGPAETALALKRLGISAVGMPSEAIVYRSVSGLRLAFLAFNAIPVPAMPDAIWNRDRALRAVSAAKNTAAAVIVLMHWGDEYSSKTIFAQENTARLLVEAGADLVIGTHPHVLQPTQVLPREGAPPAFAAYSLGNYVFDQEWEEVRQSAALRVRLDEAGVASVEALGLIAGRRPRWVNECANGVHHQPAATPATALPQTNWLERLVPPGLHMWFDCSPDGCLEMAEPTPIPRQTSASVDLTGDGEDEQIRLEAGRLVILDGGKREWISPKEWHIIDYDVGDPNDDGRGELLVVFEKPGKYDRLDRTVDNHPFLIGYRGGRYREVWGGSAVSDPIREAKVEDMDEDGQDELVVLEESCSGEYGQGLAAEQGCDNLVLSVWDWNGWGFSRKWQSISGRFHSLNIYEKGEAEKMISIVRSW